MTTTEQLQSFNRFAESRLEAGDSIDVLFGRWWAETHRDNDAAAIAASVRDFEAGERGQPLDEFLQEFDTERSGR